MIDKPLDCIGIDTTKSALGKHDFKPLAVEHSTAYPKCPSASAGRGDEPVPDDGPYPPWMLDQFTGCGIDHLDTTKTYNLTGTHLKQLLQSYRRLYYRLHTREPGREYTAPATQDDSTRCPVCHWPLEKTMAEGCVPGNCSYRPHGKG